MIQRTLAVFLLLVSQAHATRYSRQVGQRFVTLAALEKAALEKSAARTAGDKASATESTAEVVAP